MFWKTSLVLVMVVVLSNGVLPITAQGDCTPEDVDPVDLADMGVLSTAEAIAKDRRLSMDVIEKNMNEQVEKDESLKLLIEEETSLQRTMVADQEAVQQKIHFGHYWYWPTCPYHVYWLQWKHWYFSYTNHKCWAFYPIYYTSCGNKYCNMYYKPFFWWHHYYRCLPEYRYHIIWAMCYNTKGQWFKKPIKVLLKRGCCCKKFWWNKFTAIGVCPATTTKG